MTPKGKYITKGAIIGTVVSVWFLGILAPVVGALIALWMWNKKEHNAGAAGDADIKLGLAYYNGDGVVKDHRKAFECWSRNAGALDAPTALKLADMYRDGEVTEKDPKKAFELYVRAPHDEAERRIMEIFEQGVDLPEYSRYAAEVYSRRFENGEDDLLPRIISLYTALGDDANLRKYQLAAAQKGDRALAAKLGKELFPTDRAAAYRLLCSTDANGDPEIPFMLAEILASGDGAPKDEEAAKTYYRQAMDAGYGPAARGLAGVLRRSGKKAEQTRSFELYGKLAEQGDADAKYEVADMLARGIGAASDAVRAVKMWRELAETGYDAALLKIAEACHTGSGCEQDLAQALELAARAAAAKVKGAKKLLDELKTEQEEKLRAENRSRLDAAIAACENDATGEAEFKVAQLYEAGEIVERSAEKMTEYYMLAAEKGNPDALYRLGKLAEEGDDELEISPDIGRALDLYETAAKNGSADAKKTMKKVKGNIKKLEQTIIADYDVVASARGAVERTKLHDLGKFPPEYFEYEIPRSLVCAMYYRKYLVKNDKLGEEYPDSDEVRDLAIGFLSADLACDSEKCWHYAGKLISQGVYWPLFAFIKETMEDMDATMPLFCAMETHGCLDAAAFMSKIRENLKAGKNEELQKLYDVSVERAKKIDAKWLEKLSRKMDFPFMYGATEAEETADDAERYSLSDLNEAEKSSDPERREWAKPRSEIFKAAFLALKAEDVSVIDKFATLLENVLQRKYESRKYDPHLPMPKLSMSMGGDHLLYLYCNLLWKCPMGCVRRLENMLTAVDPTDPEYADMVIDSWRRNRIYDMDMLFGLTLMLLEDEKIFTDEFLYGLM